MHLGFTDNFLEEQGAIHTAREISDKPVLLKKIAGNKNNDQEKISAFINSCICEVESVGVT